MNCLFCTEVSINNLQLCRKIELFVWLYWEQWDFHYSIDISLGRPHNKKSQSIVEYTFEYIWSGIRINYTLANNITSLLHLIASLFALLSIDFRLYKSRAQQNWTLENIKLQFCVCRTREHLAM